MKYRDVIGLIGFIVVLCLTISHIWKYIRIPKTPIEMSFAEAVLLIENGERPFVALTDAQWDCENISVRRGRSRWVTDVALKTGIDSPKGVAHFWSRENCLSLQGYTIVGVLEPILRTEYSNLRQHGIDFGSSVTAQEVLHLCVTCSKEYYLKQMPIFLLFLLAVSYINLGTFRELFVMATQKDKSPLEGW